MIGDEEIGKTSLMMKYVNNEFQPYYQKTLGVNYIEKLTQLESTDIKFEIFDLGGSKEFENMINLSTKDANAIIFLFDLTNISSLENIKKWYKLARTQNKTAVPILVGTKYDLFLEMAKSYQVKVTDRSLKFSNAMNSSLIFTSSSDSINIQKVFKIMITKIFDLNTDINEYRNYGEPILIIN